MIIQHNIPDTKSTRHPAKKQSTCTSINYKFFNNILTLPPKFFQRFRPLSPPPPASESTMPTLCGGSHRVLHPAKKQKPCKPAYYKIFNSILTLPPKNFSPKSPHSPPISSSRLNQIKNTVANKKLSKL